jgi:hypothetical protein
MQIASIHTLKEINLLQNKPTQKNLGKQLANPKGHSMHACEINKKNDIIG